MILLNHHRALLLTAGATAHHHDIRAFLHHLEMLRHSLPDCKYHILLRWLYIGGVLGMYLFHINHLILRSLNVDELMIWAHLMLNRCELLRRLLDHNAVWIEAGILLLSW